MKNSRFLVNFLDFNTFSVSYKCDISNCNLVLSLEHFKINNKTYKTKNVIVNKNLKGEYQNLHFADTIFGLPQVPNSKNKGLLYKIKDLDLNSESDFYENIKSNCLKEKSSNAWIGYSWIDSNGDLSDGYFLGGKYISDDYNIGISYNNLKNIDYLSYNFGSSYMGIESEFSNSKNNNDELFIFNLKTKFCDNNFDYSNRQFKLNNNTLEEINCFSIDYKYNTIKYTKTYDNGKHANSYQYCLPVDILDILTIYPNIGWSDESTKNKNLSAGNKNCRFSYQFDI